jgi:Uncharacterised nucleotidyltransferase
MSRDKSNPAPRVLASALRRTTEFLAGELAEPGRTVPDWPDPDWQIARAVAAIHGVSALLATRLLWRGPAAWDSFIQEQKAHTFRRHLRIQELLASLDECARRDGIPFLALKGVALHELGVYTAGERPMADVDLLVLEADAPRVGRLLEALGFEQSDAYWKHLTFTRRDARPVHGFGEHATNDLKVELHTRISEILPSRLTDITGLTFPQHPRPGLNPYPSVATLMRHLLLHAAGAMAYRSLRMLHLHDIALLSRRMRPDDWDCIVELPDRNTTAWWALPPLLLTSRYYPSVVPPGVLDSLRRECAWWLRQLGETRTLSDVSLSYIYLEAFPGLGWAQSPGEMLEHVARRLGKATRLVVRRKSRSGARPENAPASFSRAPYVLKWLVSRPLRPETLSAVRAALHG